MPTETILTGHRPTGPHHPTRHTWVALQDKHACFFLVADLHVLTTDDEHPQPIPANLLDTVLDWLTAAIAPSRASLVLQSAVPAHAQFAALLGMLVTVARLERIHRCLGLSLGQSFNRLSHPLEIAPLVGAFC